MPQFELNDIVYDVMQLANTGYDYNVIRGGGGSGKSTGMAQAIALLTSSNREYNVLAVRKKKHHARFSVFAELKKWIQELGLAKQFIVNETMMTFRNRKTNSWIVCAGCHDPEDLKSITAPSGIFSLVWVEEATQLSWSSETTKNDLLQLRLRLRGVGRFPKSIFLTFNPVNKEHWIKKELIDSKQFNVVEKVYTYKDNHYIDATYAEFLESLIQSNPNAYKIYAKGEWGDLKQGLVYPNWKVEPAPTIPPMATFYGLDFGWSKGKTALVKVDVYNFEHVHFTELVYESYLSHEEMIKRVKSIVGHRTPIYCDSASPEKIASLRAAGVNALLSNKSFAAGVDTLDLLRVTYDTTSKNLHAERIEYAYAEGVLPLTPEKTPDHLLDACRYAVHTHYSTQIKFNEFLKKTYRRISAK